MSTAIIGTDIIRSLGTTVSQERPPASKITGRLGSGSNRGWDDIFPSKEGSNSYQFFLIDRKYLGGSFKKKKDLLVFPSPPNPRPRLFRRRKHLRCLLCGLDLRHSLPQDHVGFFSLPRPFPCPRRRLPDARIRPQSPPRAKTLRSLADTGGGGRSTRQFRSRRRGRLHPRLRS